MKAISIMYHDVVPDELHQTSGFPSADAALYKITPEAFDRHLHALSSTLNSAPISAHDLNSHRVEGSHRPPPRPPWMITFDDGGVSAYTTIADRLERFGWRGHFLVATDYIGTSSFVSKEQIRELDARGHIIGSHSCSHPLRMASCDRQSLLREWRDSTAKLSDILGYQVRVGSIPGGQFSRQVAEAAAAADMNLLFTSEPRTKSWTVNGCLLLGRYTIQRWMSPEVAAGLGAGEMIPCLRQALLWNAKKVVKKLGGEYYLKVRNELVGRVRSD